MSDDPVYEAFLKAAAEDAASTNSASDVVTLAPRGFGGHADTYDGLLRDVEHLERSTGGTVAVSTAIVPFVVHLPADYLRSTDPKLQFRVASVRAPLVHPNCKGGVLCLGPHFRPGTRLRSLIEQLFAIVSGRAFATADALDPSASRYYLAHLDQVRSLRSRPLWRRPLAANLRISTIARANAGAS